MGTIRPVALVILDGFGYRVQDAGNAIAQATMPHFKQWLSLYPSSKLAAAGSDVGLLPGNNGNSEVGHLTIGAGRIIEQPVLRIHKAIADGSFFNNPVLVQNLQQLAGTGKKLHIIGLVSDGVAHSHLEDLIAFIKAAQQQQIGTIWVHAILDGRDVATGSAHTYLNQISAPIGSIHGRFYAMDRDNNWKRTQKSYLALTAKQSNIIARWQDAIAQSYAQGITDEFIQPVQLDPASIIEPGDGLIFFNYRPERMVQLARCLLEHIPLAFCLTPVPYPGLSTAVMFGNASINNTLPDVLAANNKRVFVIAETEKQAQVTSYFHGMQSQVPQGQTRIIIPSIKAKTYSDHPCMSAADITNVVIHSLRSDAQDFYVINYANADMVGHSGNLRQTTAAVECLDLQLGRLFDVLVSQLNGTMYITADHGNAESMIDLATGQPSTAHTANPVYFVMISKGLEHSGMALGLHSLADIAPFILQNMGLAVPDEMSAE